MADPESQRERQLSLVPYTSDSQEIVLRHGHSVVVYDPESRQLSLHGNGNVQDTVELGVCPYCHQPLRDATGPRQFTNDQDSSSGDEHAFVDPDYFRMLAHSIPGSTTSSPRPLSPLKQLPPLRAGGSRNVSSSGPPTGAEFVGSAPVAQSSDPGIRGSSFLPGYFSTFFTEKRELGRGGKGVVLLVEHILDGVFLGEFACKRVPVGNDHSWLAKVLVEVQLLQRLNHQNLVSYRHVWLEDVQTTNFGPPVACIFILQQYCNAGDLHEYVVGSMQTTSNPEMLKERMRRRSKGREERPQDLDGPRKIPFDEVFSFFRDITSGLHHLHTNGYIHRDLKPSNCLLHRTGARLTAHVSDFGEVQATHEKRASTGATGTISYCAPEVLLRKPGSTDERFGDFTTKSDIFSLGMIVYFMCFGRLPYTNFTLDDSNEDLNALRAEVSAWTGFNDSFRARSDLPEKLYKFLKKLLSPDPQERPSTEQILQAIKAGSSLDDIDVTGVGARTPDLSEIAGSRISSVDSPRPQKDARLRGGISSSTRPDLSKLPRHYSRELMQHPRSPPPPSAPRRSSNHTESAVALRSPLPETVARTGSNKQMPRQLLAPPPRFRDRLLPSPAAVILVLKICVFALKFFVVSWPCAPFAGNALLVYPLMGVALLDFALVRNGAGISLGLSVLHFSAAALAARKGVLCGGVDWGEVV